MHKLTDTPSTGCRERHAGAFLAKFPPMPLRQVLTGFPVRGSPPRYQARWPGRKVHYSVRQSRRAVRDEFDGERSADTIKLS